MKTTRVMASLVLAIGLARGVSAQLPPGWYMTNNDPSSLSGSASYDEAMDTWTVTVSRTSSGEPGLLSPCPDPGFCVYKGLNGDGEIIANIVSNDGVDGLSPNGAGVGVTVGEDLTSLEAKSSAMEVWRDDHKYNTDFASCDFLRAVSSSDFPYRRIRIVRAGDIITGYAYGSSGWEQKGTTTLSMSYDVYVGFYVYPGLRTSTVKITLGDNPGGGTAGSGNDWTVNDTNMVSAVKGNVGIGIPNPAAKLDVLGRIRISDSAGKALVELGGGLDYAEGFNVADKDKIGPGTVLVIDPANPGKLRLSAGAYDKKVAGIVAGARGLGSAVRLGVGRFDHDVALAGRVYCNVDATKADVEPGDLLTTSPTLGYAMKAVDYRRAQGAILGKAMEPLAKGKKGQILVLVTLQ